MRRSPAPGSADAARASPSAGEAAAGPIGGPSRKGRRKAAPRRLLGAGGVLLLGGGLAGSLLLARYVHDGLSDGARHRVDLTTSAVVSRLTAKLRRYGDLVVSTGAFVSSVSSQAAYAPTRQAFLDYLSSLKLPQQYPGVYGVGFISRVPAARATALDAQMRAAGQPGFNLPQPGAAFACPVAYFDWTGAGSPPGAYLTADICGIAQVQDLLTQAEASGQPVVAAQVAFAGGPNHKYDFAVIDPVFPAGATASDPVERHGSLQGWSIGLFQGQTLAAGLIPAGSPDVAVRVFTGPSTNANDLVFASRNHLPDGLVQATRTTVEEDGPWTLQIFRGPVEGLSAVLVPLAVIAAGLVVTVAVFLVIYVLARSEAIARRQVERATASLRESETLFRSLATASPAGVMRTDRHGSCLYANPTMCDISGRREEALHGFGWFDAIHPDDREELQDTLGPLVGKRPELSHHARVVTPQGRVHDASIRASALKDATGRINGYVVAVEDVTQQVRTRDHLQHLALHDQLTGLPNRALFVDRLRQALARAQRGDEAVAVLFLDLDRFKLVNDSLGHQAGDELLVLTAERIKGLLRSDETLARLGGDEFAILLEELSGVADATGVASRIISRLEDPFVLRSNEAFVSVSIGIVLSTDVDPSPDALLRDADTAMYQAKSRGGGGFEVFDAKLHESVVHRLETESSLRHAVEHGELTVHYQPQLDTVTREIVGVEALVRWNHPRRGLMDPSEFVPLAEETGLIVPIGSWVLRHAIRDLGSWRRRLPWLTPRLAVNLSARQLADPQVASNVLEALYDARFDPSSLCLEVTESVLMADTTPGFETLATLRSHGVHLAIDDFGTGFSSLAALKRLPVDVLKIDRSFVVDLEAGEKDRAMLAGVVAIGHALGLEIVAEGVENERQVEILREIGAEVGQGFLWCTPVPSAELVAWAEAHDRAIGRPRPPWSAARLSAERPG